MITASLYRRDDPTKGDATFAFPEDDDWTVEAVASSGHDGWDNRIFAAPDGQIHLSAVDSRDFNGVGVEYYNYDGSGWTVEQVGGPVISYGRGTSVAADSTGTPHVVFFDDDQRDLLYATKGGDEWVRQRVDTDGETGMFPDVAIDDRDRPHLSYVGLDGESGVVRYAVLTDGSWDVETVDGLPDLFVSRRVNGKGARNTTSIVLDGAGRPSIGYADEQRLNVASLAGGEWRIQTVAEAGDVPLGQITAVALDDEGGFHLTFSTVSGIQPLDGEVWYATGTPQV